MRKAAPSSWAPTGPWSSWSAWTIPSPRCGPGRTRPGWPGGRAPAWSCCTWNSRPALYGAAAGAGAAAIAEQERAFSETAADLKRRIDEAVAERGVPITFIVAAGDPYHELRRVADEVRADAVVVGASTKAGHRLVGSLAVRLVKAGRWPVTVVP